MLRKRKNAKKQKNSNKDMTIVTDIKEPFSFRRFVDETIVEGWKGFKKKLDERGITFFLTSPFQYRYRLLIIFWSICLGMVLGIVPRSVNLINETKIRNAQSEIASIENKIFSNAKIMVTPLKSSQYNKQHVIVFNIKGDTKSGVPSTDDGFDVKLTSLRGVAGAEDVKYRYKIVPLDLTSRLLVLYVDNRNQNDNTGIFGLNIAVKGEKMMRDNIELTLSNNQETNDLFKNDKLNLSVVSNKLTDGVTAKDAISKAKEQLENAQKVYKINEDRLMAQGITLEYTSEKLAEFVDKNLILKHVEDDSTTNVVTVKIGEIPIQPRLESVMYIRGEKYTEEKMKTDSKKEMSLGAKEIAVVNEQINEIMGQVRNLNTVRFTKYKALENLTNVLKRDLSVTSFNNEKNVTPND